MARRPHEAAAAFTENLGRAISCVTNAVFDIRGGYHPTPTPHVAALNSGLPVPLAGAAGLRLSVLLQYHIVQDSGSHGPWIIRTSAYSYTVWDRDEQELLVYHWHPDGRSAVTVPHLHIGSTALATGSTLVKKHLPTRRITLDDVVRLVITELDVVPRRQDWAMVLQETAQVFEVGQT